jgi:hypothetical protein
MMDADGRLQTTLQPFSIEHELESGEIVSGQFTPKRLSGEDMMQRSRRFAMLTDGRHCVFDEDMNPTGRGIPWEDHRRAEVLAHLSVSLVQTPTWWKPAEIPEDPLDPESVIWKVYAKVVEQQDSFRRRRRQGAGQAGAGTAPGRPADGGGEGGGQTAGAETVAARDAGGMGDRQARFAP